MAYSDYSPEIYYRIALEWALRDYNNISHISSQFKEDYPDAYRHLLTIASLQCGVNNPISEPGVALLEVQHKEFVKYLDFLSNATNALTKESKRVEEMLNRLNESNEKFKDKSTSLEDHLTLSKSIIKQTRDALKAERSFITYVVDALLNALIFISTLTLSYWTFRKFKIVEQETNLSKHVRLFEKACDQKNNLFFFQNFSFPKASAPKASAVAELLIFDDDHAPHSASPVTCSGL
jgi:hypothetical protein